MEPVGKDMRRSVRQKVEPEVDVNRGVPHRGGRLLDISTRGAAIIYPTDKDAVDSPLQVGEMVRLNIGTTELPSRIVRLFGSGFAVQFDWAAGFSERK